jgi:dienelactone hydrolase
VILHRADPRPGVKLDTTAERWTKLQPHVQVFGPDDDKPRPAVILFHGCGGMRPHLPLYAQAAVDAGWRAFVVDSYAPRGWGRAVGLGLVCTGAIFHGSERSGDVLAALWGVGRRADVDASTLVLAGWSHGGWAIMDLMTLPLDRPGHAYLADPDAALLDGVQGLFLVYPYVNVGALSRLRPWVRGPRTYAVIAEKDHLVRPPSAERIYHAARRGGADVTLWTSPGTHSFDEGINVGLMRFHAEAAAECRSRFSSFLSGFG